MAQKLKQTRLVRFGNTRHTCIATEVLGDERLETDKKI